MDLSHLKLCMESLYKYLEDNGYSKRYCNNIRACYHNLLRYEGNDNIKSYEDFYYKVVVKKYARATWSDKRLGLSILWGIDLFNQYPSPIPSSKQHHFLKEDSLLSLSKEYQNQIALFVNQKIKQQRRQSSINNQLYGIKAFLNYLQGLGITHLQDVDSETIDAYFFQDGKIIRGTNVVRILRDYFSTISDLESIAIPCLAYLPMIRTTKKAYEALAPDEVRRLQAIIDNPSDSISLRDKAILRLCFYLGLRRGDIANLKLEDIDFAHDRISFIQSKTSSWVQLPLRPIVGNAVYDYLINERPNTFIRNLFLINDGKEIRPITPWAIYDVMKRVYALANIRVCGGKIGAHMLRHNMAVSLINSGCDSIEVSSIMGHVSPTSIETYLSSDEIKLRECALSIESFPIKNNLFKE
jgi:integrase